MTQLDQHFERELAAAQELRDRLDKKDRISLNKWLTRLQYICRTRQERILRNRYLDFLILQIRVCGRLDEPFTHIPPDGNLEALQLYRLERLQVLEARGTRKPGGSSRSSSPNAAFVPLSSSSSNRIQGLLTADADLNITIPDYTEIITSSPLRHRNAYGHTYLRDEPAMDNVQIQVPVRSTSSSFQSQVPTQHLSLHHHTLTDAFALTHAPTAMPYTPASHHFANQEQITHMYQQLPHESIQQLYLPTSMGSTEAPRVQVLNPPMTIDDGDDLGSADTPTNMAVALPVMREPPIVNKSRPIIDVVAEDILASLRIEELRAKPEAPLQTTGMGSGPGTILTTSRAVREASQKRDGSPKSSYSVESLRRKYEGQTARASPELEELRYVVPATIEPPSHRGSYVHASSERPQEVIRGTQPDDPPFTLLSPEVGTGSVLQLESAENNIQGEDFGISVAETPLEMTAQPLIEDSLVRSDLAHAKSPEVQVVMAQQRNAYTSLTTMAENIQDVSTPLRLYAQATQDQDQSQDADLLPEPQDDHLVRPVQPEYEPHPIPVETLIHSNYSSAISPKEELTLVRTPVESPKRQRIRIMPDEQARSIGPTLSTLQPGVISSYVAPQPQTTLSSILTPVRRPGASLHSSLAESLGAATPLFNSVRATPTLILGQPGEQPPGGHPSLSALSVEHQMQPDDLEHDLADVESEPISSTQLGRSALVALPDDDLTCSAAIRKMHESMTSPKPHEHDRESFDETEPAVVISSNKEVVPIYRRRSRGPPPATLSETLDMLKQAKADGVITLRRSASGSRALSLSRRSASTSHVLE